MTHDEILMVFLEAAKIQCESISRCKITAGYPFKQVVDEDGKISIQRSKMGVRESFTVTVEWLGEIDLGDGIGYGVSVTDGKYIKKCVIDPMEIKAALICSDIYWALNTVISNVDCAIQAIKEAREQNLPNSDRQAEQARTDNSRQPGKRRRDEGSPGIPGEISGAQGED